MFEKPSPPQRTSSEPSDGRTGLDLRADFSERRNLAAADILNLNDVEAVFRADRADNIALLRTENRGFKCRNHCPFAEPAEVTALLGAGRSIDSFFATAAN